MLRYPDGYFHWAVPDPPYGIGVGKMAYLEEVKTRVRQANGTRLAINKVKHFKSDWDFCPPDQGYFDLLRLKSVNQIIFGVNYFDWVGIGPGRIIWNKGVPNGMSFSGTETAYCSSIDYEVEINLLWSGMQQAKSLSEPMTPQGNKRLNEKRIHPTQKPVLLYMELLRRFVEPGMNVLDTHQGSGSLRIACDMYGCNYVGCETEKRYFDKEEKRFAEYKSALKLFEWP